jgi:hypothetical protein
MAARSSLQDLTAICFKIKSIIILDNQIFLLYFSIILIRNADRHGEA